MAGKQLKELRIRLGLSQQALAGPQITRNLISMIENEKTPLTASTAELLAERINSLFSESGEFAPITAEDLAEPARYQARQEVHNLLGTINAYQHEPHFNISTYLARLSGIFSQWDLPSEKFSAYQAIAEHFEARGKNQEAHLYFSRAYENAGRTSDPSHLAVVALGLSRTALKLEHYHSAILSAEALRSYEGRIPDRLLLEIFFNQAQAHMAEEDFDQALNSLIFCEHLIPDGPSPSLYQLLTMKIECYLNKGMRGIAARILAALKSQFESDTAGKLQGVQITLCCIECAMDPQSVDASKLQILWNEFSQNPSQYSDYEQLFFRLMESAFRAQLPNLFDAVAWRAVTDISPLDHPVVYRKIIDLIRTAWPVHPDLNLTPHWRYILRSPAVQISPGYSGILLSFMSIFHSQNRQDLIQECLNQWNQLQ